MIGIARLSIAEATPLLIDHLKQEYKGAESKLAIKKTKMELFQTLAKSYNSPSRPYLYLRFWKL